MTESTFRRQLREILEGQRVVARSDGTGGWVEQEEYGIYIEDEGIDHVIDAIVQLIELDLLPQETTFIKVGRVKQVDREEAAFYEGWNHCVRKIRQKLTEGGGE